MGRLYLSFYFTLLLYAGPVLGAWSGAGWADWPIYTLIFVLWSVIMRPGQWRGGAGRIVVTVGVMAILPLVLLALGWGLAALMHVTLPRWLPFAVTGAGAVLPRLFVNPAKADALNGFLTDAIDQIRAAGPDFDDDPLSAAEQAAVDALLALPDDSPDAAAALAQAVALPDPYGVMLALSRALDVKNPPRRALRRAVIEWETDLSRLGHRPYPLPRNAFEVAGQDTELLMLYLDRADAMLAADPLMWADFPDPSDVALVNFEQPPELARRLQGHIEAIERAAGLA